jgi:hypothetical protein
MGRIVVGLMVAAVVGIGIFMVRTISQGISEQGLKPAYNVRLFWLIIGWVFLGMGGLFTLAAPLPEPPGYWGEKLVIGLAMAILGLAFVRINWGAPTAALLRYVERNGAVQPKDLIDQVGLTQEKAVAHLEQMVKEQLLVKENGTGVFALYSLPHQGTSGSPPKGT